MTVVADPQDQVSDYLAQIGATPLLTAEEETALAKRYAHRGMSLADVIQDGNLGLIEAVERFDHTRGNRFSTWGIRKAIQHGAHRYSDAADELHHGMVGAVLPPRAPTRAALPDRDVHLPSPVQDPPEFDHLASLAAASARAERRTGTT